MVALSLIVAGLLGMAGCQIEVPFDKYHGYDEVGELLHGMAKKLPNLALVESIGKSVRGLDLWALTIGTPPTDTGDLRPNFKIVANLHGDDGLSLEMTLFIAQRLLNAKKKDATSALRALGRFHIVPTLNPDVYEEAPKGICNADEEKGHHNSNEFDINENFPSMMREKNKDTAPEAPELQPETEAIMKWMNDTRFTLGLNLFGGGLVVVYPYQASVKTPISEGNYQEELSPDQDIIRSLAMNYATRHKNMKKAECPNGKVFSDGITNGAALSPAFGSLMDYSYDNGSCIDLNLFVSCCHSPPPEELRDFWLQNRIPMFEYFMDAQCRVNGFVTETNSGEPVVADLWIQGREGTIFKTDSKGRFWRVLLPGKYFINVTADEHKDIAAVPFTISSRCRDTGATRLDVKLQKCAGSGLVMWWDTVLVCLALAVSANKIRGI